jgi:hypothetical protein
MGYRWSRGAGESSLIKVLYCFHQNNNRSRCEVVHPFLPIRLYKIRVLEPRGEHGTDSTFAFVLRAPTMRERVLLFCLLGLVLIASILLVTEPAAVTWALALVE